MKYLILSIFVIITLSFFSNAQNTEKKWYKGNTHTHTLNSDGDSTPDEVARWYREHGYHFLVLTDHNFLTNVDALNALHGADEQYLIIPGEEVTDKYAKKPIHVNGLNLETLVLPQGGNSVVETLQRNIDAVNDVGGLPHINHPNFGWAITAAEMAEVQRYKLFEVFNGHPLINNFGGGGMPGLEEMWDIILSSGKLLYGVATDDAHHFKSPWNRNAAAPGRGWVVVRADSLNAATIIAALASGDFYSSTGVSLKDYQVDGEQIVIDIENNRGHQQRFNTLFIGENGEILKTDVENPATYLFKGNEKYVRAKIIDSNGNVAWTQPVMR